MRVKDTGHASIYAQDLDLSTTEITNHTTMNAWCGLVEALRERLCGRHPRRNNQGTSTGRTRPPHRRSRIGGNNRGSCRTASSCKCYEQRRMYK